MSSLFLRSAAVLLLAAQLAACASEPPEPPPRLGPLEGPDGAHPPGAGLFISPSGQPFRSKPGEPYPSAAWFANADTNHDGRLSREEFVADADAFFKVLDTDRDGIIDGFEISDYERKIAPEILPRIAGLRFGEGMDQRLLNDRGGRGGRGGGPGGGGGGARRAVAGDRAPQGAALYSMLSDPQPVSAADADLSGKITLDEWRATARARFATLDKTNLGYLTLATLPKPPAQVAAEQRAERAAKRRPR